jgi:hypothetical protein
MGIAEQADKKPRFLKIHASFFAHPQERHRLQFLDRAGKS